MFFFLKIKKLKKMTQTLTQRNGNNDTTKIKLTHNLTHRLFGECLSSILTLQAITKLK